MAERRALLWMIGPWILLAVVAELLDARPLSVRTVVDTGSEMQCDHRQDLGLMILACMSASPQAQQKCEEENPCVAVKAFRACQLVYTLGVEGQRSVRRVQRSPGAWCEAKFKTGILRAPCDGPEVLVRCG